MQLEHAKGSYPCTNSLCTHLQEVHELEQVLAHAVPQRTARGHEHARVQSRAQGLGRGFGLDGATNFEKEPCVAAEANYRG